MKADLYLKFLLFIAVLLIIPLLWANKLEFDLAQFTTIWYKTGIDLAKILFGFWLANIFWAQIKKRDDESIKWEIWRQAGRNMLGAVDILRKIADIDNDSFEEAHRYFKEGYYQLVDISNCANDVQRADFRDALLTFRGGVGSNMADLLQMMEEGRILCGKTLDNKTRKILDDVESLFVASLPQND